MVAAERNISLCLAPSNSGGAFLFPYRYVFRGVRYPDALNDLQQAMRYVKAYAEDYGIDTARVAAMGFCWWPFSDVGRRIATKGRTPYFMVPSILLLPWSGPSNIASTQGTLGDSRMKDRALRDLLP